MNTMQAEDWADIVRLAEYMAKQDVKATNCEKRMLLWVMSVITLATTIILDALD